MPNYRNSKLYSIRSISNPELVYIGATVQPLYLRYSEHKRRKAGTVKQIIDLGDSYIELIENYPCDNKEQLSKREGELIRSMNCVNKQIPNRTEEEKKEYIYEFNRTPDRMKYKREWMQENRRNPEFKQKEKERQKEYNKRYRQKKRENYLFYKSCYDFIYS